MKPPTIWQVANAMFVKTDFDAQLRARQLSRMGFRAATFLVHDGLTQYDIPEDVLDAFSNEGFVIGGWGVLRVNPGLEAQIAMRACRKKGFRFWVANAELEYQDAFYAPGKGDRKRAAKYVGAFRYITDIPAALSTYGNVRDHIGSAAQPNIDFDTFRTSLQGVPAGRDKLGFRLWPQAYWNEKPIWQPSACVQQATDIAYHPAWVHPTIGLHNSSEPTCDAYLADLERAGVKGWSLYRPESSWHRMDELAASMLRFQSTLRWERPVTPPVWYRATH